MTFRTLLLGAALAAAPGWLRAQSAAITLSGQLANCPDSSTVNVMEPVPDGYLNYYYSDGPNEALVRGGRFSYALRTQPTGLVAVQSKCLPQLMVFVEPGAQLSLTGRGDSVTFEGTNAAANNLLARKQLLNGGPPDGAAVRQLLASAPKAATVQRALAAHLQKPLAALAALYERRQISRACYDYLRAETEQRLVFWAAAPLLSYFVNPVKRAELQWQLPEAEARKVAAWLFKTYDPTAARYRFSTLDNAATQARLRRLQVLPGKAPAQLLWTGYQKQFAGVNDDIGAYDYAPANVQMLGVGNFLVYALSFKAMSGDDFARAFADYVRLFPTSPYVPVLTRAMLAERGTGAAPAAPAPDANLTFGHLAAGAKALRFGPAPQLAAVKTLEELVKQQFAGRPVFVDLWASWCGPCIAEFRHEPALYDFLQKEGVEIVYVALDKPGYRDKWAAFVAKNRLRGYHYLASPAVQDALAPTVPYIPRYLLFDKTGALVEASAEHPSSGLKLQQQVRARLGK
ncbi:TlpA disulfide reductase family protein [Hymenobacter sp. ASUV-10]|uniref:TlpA disulfide reductase family protein n=1 Tax=Hymenobacter aranciens TaxID=3063996 RepID=A0ABT9B9X1_9BACT|nr:TlpA disulfide reductase family protein [Hymenobacter sp. ASUV-10]MDO7873491.1 TlpA disulfide reductase family protein [Hymenobacter sp. ASUV-10]